MVASVLLPGQAGEVDQIKVTIIIHKDYILLIKKTEIHMTLHVEYKVVFAYVRDGTTFEETVIGLDDPSGLTRRKDGRLLLQNS